MLFSPLEQFDLTPINICLWTFFCGPTYYSFTTIVFIFLVLIISILYIFWFILPVKNPIHVSFVIIINDLLILIKDITQAKIVNTGFLNIFGIILFLFISASNWIGLVSFGYTITAIILLPFILSITAFTISNYAGYKNFNILYLSLFKPSGIAWILKPMLILIELISHTIRALSLAVRLFANMFAGHVLIYILSTTLLLIITNPWIPIVGVTTLNIIYLVIYSLETFIALLQAYVFTALVGIYLTETMDH